MEKPEKNHTHVAYSDESYYSEGKYSSICMLSMKLETSLEIEQKMNSLLKESGLIEFKWVKLGSARERMAAKKIIDLVFPYLKNKSLRIDVIIWDSYKRKEEIPESNNLILGKMYYHLFRNVLTRRWPDDAEWMLFPDKQGVIDWNELKDILKNVSSKIFIRKNEDGGCIFEIKREFSVHEIEEVDSKKAPLCQIADFFSGLASFYNLECPSSNLSLDQTKLIENGKSLSNRQRERIDVINYLKIKFSNNSFEVTFDPKKGVFSKNPNGQVNFWPFETNLSRYRNNDVRKWL